MKHLLILILGALLGALIGLHTISAHDGVEQAQTIRPFGVQRSGNYCVFWTQQGYIAVVPAPSELWRCQ